MLEKRRQPGGAFSLVAISILLLPFAGKLRRSRKWLRQFTIVSLLWTCAGIVATLTGCGGKNSGGGGTASQTQTYTITVTATSGALSHSTNVTLTVQP
jgi:hypothetical protein